MAQDNEVESGKAQSSKVKSGKAQSGEVGNGEIRNGEIRNGPEGSDTGASNKGGYDAGRITVVPATADRFDDVTRVLNPNGRAEACWCMHWRAPAKEDVTTRDTRLRELTEQDPAPGMLAYLATADGAVAGPGATAGLSVATGPGGTAGLSATPGPGGTAGPGATAGPAVVPGTGLGPTAGERAEVAGWLGFSRRSAARSLQRSRVLPAGEPETWPTTWVFMCVTVRAGFRRQGVAQALLDAGVEYAAAHGATAIDAFPVEPEAGRRVPVSAAFVGTVAMFERAGFDRLAPTDATSGRLMRWHMRHEVTPA